MGEAVAIDAVDGDYAIIGGPNAHQIDPSGPGVDGGAAWIFSRDASQSLDDEQRWFLEQVIQHPLNPVALDMFGFSVAISGDRAVVGAPSDGHGGLTEPGSAFVFQRNANGTWSYEPPALRIASPGDKDFLGWSVDIDNTDLVEPPRVVVGAPDTAGGTGRFHIFEWIVPTGQQQPRIWHRRDRRSLERLSQWMGRRSWLGRLSTTTVD